jgi:hypothetical protein
VLPHAIAGPACPQLFTGFPILRNPFSDLRIPENPFKILKSIVNTIKFIFMSNFWSLGRLILDQSKFK